MKRLLLITLGLGGLALTAKANLSSAAKKTASPFPSSEGPRLTNYEAELKRLFPSTTRVTERPFLPRTSGGTTFTGLVNRLLGEATHSEHESIDLRRFIYEAYKGNELLGLAHSSEYESKSHPRVRVDIFYDTNGVIKDMKIGGVPDSLLKKLHSEGHLAQFVGRTPEDFEIKRNRRGRISKTGDFLTSYKRPGGEVQKYFESLLRSVRYNAAFMDVAFFITQHPNLDRDSRRLRVVASENGPEAYVSSTTVVENLEDGSLLLKSGRNKN